MNKSHEEIINDFVVIKTTKDITVPKHCINTEGTSNAAVSAPCPKLNKKEMAELKR